MPIHSALRCLPLLILLVLLGCSKSDPATEAIGPALYGDVKPTIQQEVTRPPHAVTNDWRRSPFYVLQTELSPATLIFTTNKYLSLFTGLEKFGLGAPSHLAFATRGGPRAFTNGARLVADQLDEAWLIVWFAGAKGWTNWDVPWAVFLERKPASIKLDSSGLHFGFRNSADHVVVMPVFGYYKPPLQGAKHPWPVKKVTTWKWAEVLPTDLLMRVRFWASTAREFPIYCEDSFSIDRTGESVNLHQRFEWISTRDDWNTKPIKLSPVPPALGFIAESETSPAVFSGKVMDLDLPTPLGPYKGIPDASEYNVRLRVLKYVNQTVNTSTGTNKVTPEESATTRQQLQGVARDTGWASLASDGDRAAACLHAARLLYRVGDLDGYGYASSLFARELMQLWFRQRAADYFQKHQPWHSMAPLPPKAFPSGPITPDSGWQFSAQPPQVQDEDVARFFRDYSQTVKSNALARLLIPPAPATERKVGIERDVRGPGPSLLINVTNLESGAWPLLAWGGQWKTPSGDPWTFGHVQPGSPQSAPQVRVIPLNWNTRVLVYE